MRLVFTSILQHLLHKNLSFMSFSTKKKTSKNIHKQKVPQKIFKDKATQKKVLKFDMIDFCKADYNSKTCTSILNQTHAWTMHHLISSWMRQNLIFFFLQKYYQFQHWKTQLAKILTREAFKISVEDAEGGSNKHVLW